MKEEYYIRNARAEEFETIGKLMVNVYAQLEGFPKPDEQPAYYNMLANIGEFTKKPGTELLVAVSNEERIAGAVVHFSDMQYYGSGGTATREKNAAGFRLLAVDPACLLISSIRSIGFFAAIRRSSSIVISGSSYSIQRYSFSSVFRFMCGQSLQAQELLGGAGIKVLLGEAFSI